MSNPYVRLSVHPLTLFCPTINKIRQIKEDVSYMSGGQLSCSVQTYDSQTEQQTSDKYCWVFQVVRQITEHTVLTASNVTAALTKQL